MKTLRFDDPRLPRLMQEGAILSGYGVGYGEPDGYLLMDDEDEPEPVQPEPEELEPAAWTNARAAEEIEARDRRREGM
jgi:hypothetical protein